MDSLPRESSRRLVTCRWDDERCAQVGDCRTVRDRYIRSSARNPVGRLMKCVPVALICCVSVACGWEQNAYSERGDGIHGRVGFVTLSPADAERVVQVAGVARGAAPGQGVQALPSAVAAANVDDFGADPTGSVDSSAAIQAAMDSGIPHILFSSSGTYKVNTPIVVS